LGKEMLRGDIRMYAAIFSPEEEIDFDDVINELSIHGWQVVGKGIDQLDNTPANLMVWILYGLKSFRVRQLPYRGFVRIASENPRPLFIVAKSSWSAAAYYKILIWILCRWQMLKLALIGHT
jgi:hypothetical protein